MAGGLATISHQSAASVVRVGGWEISRADQKDANWGWKDWSWSIVVFRCQYDSGADTGVLAGAASWPPKTKKAAWWSDVVAQWLACTIDCDNKGGMCALSIREAEEPGLWKVKW